MILRNAIRPTVFHSYARLPDNNFQQGNIKIVLVEGYVAHSDITSNNPHIAERLKRLSEKSWRKNRCLRIRSIATAS